jgi:hypothetical protein
VQQKGYMVPSLENLRQFHTELENWENTIK